MRGIVLFQDETPSVRRLLLLHRVARHGTLAGAAGELGVSASAVSQQIKALERELGVAVLDRGPQGVNLTGAGELVVGRAQALLAVLDETRSALDQLSGDAGGRVSIGSIGSAAGAVVLPAITRIHERTPGLQMQVTTLEPEESLDLLLDGRLDIAVIDIYDHVPLALPEHLNAVLLHHEPLVIVTAPGDTRSKATELNSFAEAAWVMPPAAAACGQAVRHACRAQGFEPQVRWETDDLYLLTRAVAQGHGVSLLPRLTIVNGIGPLTVRTPTDRQLHRKILAVTRGSAAKRPSVARVLEELKRRSKTK